jgi:hypothetical protein
MTHGNRKLADERFPAGREALALDRLAADWIRPIADDHGHAMLAAARRQLAIV